MDQIKSAGQTIKHFFSKIADAIGNFFGRIVRAIPFVNKLLPKKSESTNTADHIKPLNERKSEIVTDSRNTSDSPTNISSKHTKPSADKRKKALKQASQHIPPNKPARTQRTRVRSNETTASEKRKPLESWAQLPDQTAVIKDDPAITKQNYSIKHSDPAQFTSTWVPLYEQSSDGKSQSTAYSVDGDSQLNTFYKNQLPAISPSEIPAVSVDNKPEIAIAIDHQVTVDHDTVTDVVNEVSTDASSATDVSQEIDTVHKANAIKPKDWRDFLETDTETIESFNRQMRNAAERRTNKQYDALYDYWRSGNVKFAPETDKYKLVVSQEAAEKYHDIYFNGTSVDGYRLGEQTQVIGR